MQEEIYSSSYAAAAYLEHIKFPADKKVYVVGEVCAQPKLLVVDLCLLTPCQLLDARLCLLANLCFRYAGSQSSTEEMLAPKYRFYHPCLAICVRGAWSGQAN